MTSPLCAADKVREKHGMTEVTVETAARVLRVSHAEVVSLVEAGHIVSPRRDPAGELVIDYGSVIDYIVRSRGSKAAAPCQEKYE